MAGEGGEQVTVAVGFSKVKCAQLSAQLVLRNNKYDSLLVSSRLVSKKKPKVSVRYIWGSFAVASSVWLANSTR